MSLEEAEQFQFSGDLSALEAAAASLEEEATPPSISDPLDGPVTLPGGFRRIGLDGSVTNVTTAWVRELNGEDEERIAKARLKNDLAAWIDAVLEGGVERLGDKPATLADLHSLTVGDRDFLLLEISRATYGDEIEYEDFVCYHCEETLSFTVHKGEDIPVKRLNSIDEIEFEVPLRNDRIARVHLPTGDAQGQALAASTPAEVNTILIAGSVSEVISDGVSEPVGGDITFAKRLSLRDRRSIIDAMSERMPGPQYNEVRFTHPEPCGREIRMAVTHADLFRGL